MDSPQHWLHNKVFLIIFFLLLSNLIALDVFVGMNLSDKTNKGVGQAITATTAVPTTDPTLITDNDTQTCSLSCLSAINEAVAPLKLTPSPTPRLKSQPTPPKTATLAYRPSVASQKEVTVKEFFIPLGSGSSTAADWTDVPGVKAEIDNTKYGQIQKVLFEASVHVPNSNEIVEVRLYNETDRYVVSNSDFLYPSGTTQNFRIAEIQLGQGAKTYKVQIRTQLQYTAILDQARVHITTF
jgi:hypothetical protein